MSRILNRKTWNGRTQEALELQGIAVVNAESNADVPRMVEFFRETGLAVVGVLDRTNDDAILQAVTASSACTFLHLSHTGLETLLADELPIEVLRRLLAEAPYCKTPLRQAATVAAMTEENLRAASRECLQGNKGSAGMHEWMLSLLDETTIPRTLAVIVDLVSGYVTNGTALATQTLLP